MDPVGRLERLLEATARRLSGGSIHPLELLEQVAAALRDHSAGGVIPNGITVGLSRRDYEAYAEAREALAIEIDALARRVEREGGFRRVGPITVSVEESATAALGLPDVRLRFFERESPLLIAEPALPTRRLRRQSGLALVLPDGTRVPVTHTPFVIGRAADADLVIPSMTVSRRHAEIVEVGGRLVLRDLGGRNGVVSAGVRVREAPLAPGSAVQLGDLTLWVEPSQ